MSTIVFDIETHVDTDVYEPTDDGDFAPAPAHVISTLGYAVFATVRGGVAVTLDAVQGDEAAILQRFATFLNAEQKPTLVSWNGRGFDLPVIVARAMKHRVHLPQLFTGKYETDYLNRFQGPHIDLMDRVSLFGGGRRCSQDVWAKSLGLPGKHVGSGDKVRSMTLAEEAAYCLDDVAQLAIGYLCWREVREGRRMSAAHVALGSAILAEPRLSRLAGYLKQRRAADDAEAAL